MLAEQLKRSAEGPEVDQVAEETIARLDLTPAQTSALRAYGRSRLEGLHALAEALAAPEDEGELFRTVAAYWLELRFEWQRNNEVMNYRQAQGKAADALVIGQGAVGSAVLACLEKSLERRNLEELAGYALELLARARDRHATSESATHAAARPAGSSAGTLSSCLLALTGNAQLLADASALTEELQLGESEQRQVMAYLARKHKDLLDLGSTLATVEEEPELHRAMAALWLELRFEWQRYNMVLNYQAIQGAPTDPVRLACAAHCSGILGRIETLLDANDHERMAAFAADLISGSDDDLRRHFGDARIADAAN